MPIEIRELKAGDKKTLKDFLNVVDCIYKDSPYYVRPLDFDVSDRLDHPKNPFFEHAEGTAWVAYRTGAPSAASPPRSTRSTSSSTRTTRACSASSIRPTTRRSPRALLAEAEAGSRPGG